MRTRLVSLLMAAVLVAACGAASDPTTTIRSAPQATTSSVAPATTTTAGISASTTRTPDVVEMWAATYRRHPPGYVIELIELHSERRIRIDANRYDPYPGALFGDGRRGLVFAKSVTHLPAGARIGTQVDPSGAWADTVALIEGQPVALARVTEGESGWDDDIIWRDETTSLVAQPLDGPPTVVLTAEMASRINYFTGEGDQEGGSLSKVAYGGDVLALLWTRLYDCGWLELRAGLSTEPAPVINPFPDERCGETNGGLLEVAVSSDGELLFVQVLPSTEPALGGSDLVAWDLTTGREIARLAGTLQFVHDGDRAFIVDRRLAGDAHETVLAVLDEDGFTVTPQPSIEDPLGVVSGPVHVYEAASLMPAAPWLSCSAANADGALPVEPTLPAAVADTRDAIVGAAAACDLMSLGELAAVTPAFRMVDADVACDEPWPMALSDDDVVPYWYHGDREFGELATILDVLAAPHIVAGDRFVWTGEHGYRIELGQDGAWLLNWRTFPQPPCESIECTC